MKSFAAAAVLLTSAKSVLGHAIWQQLWIDGVDQVGTCVRMPPSNSPVTDPTSQDLACNAGGATGMAGMCAVTAGQTVTVEMHQHNTRDCTQEAIGGAHHGPVIVYMAAVTDATTADPTAASWFKVAEEGYDVATKVWADTTLNDNCGKKNFIVPTDLATGDYLVRAELIALHTAGSAGGAQFYMSCYQIHVEGTGSASPAGVSFPGAYSATDPGILINIYNTIDEYIIPGPELYGAAAAGPAASPSSVPAAAAPSSAVPAASSSTVPLASPSSVAPAASSAVAPAAAAPSSDAPAVSYNAVPLVAPSSVAPAASSAAVHAAAPSSAAPAASVCTKRVAASRAASVASSVAVHAAAPSGDAPAASYNAVPLAAASSAAPAASVCTKRVAASRAASVASSVAVHAAAPSGDAPAASYNAVPLAASSSASACPVRATSAPVS